MGTFTKYTKPSSRLQEHLGLTRRGTPTLNVCSPYQHHSPQTIQVHSTPNPLPPPYLQDHPTTPSQLPPIQHTPGMAGDPTQTHPLPTSSTERNPIATNSHGCDLRYPHRKDRPVQYTKCPTPPSTLLKSLQEMGEKD